MYLIPLDHIPMPRHARTFFIVWGVLLAVTITGAIAIWITAGWPTGGLASVPVLVTLLVGLPGAINNLRQVQSSTVGRSAGSEGSGMGDNSRFEWTPGARGLLMVLARELPSQNDVLSCARASGTNPARVLLSGTADNAWQSLIEIAHESSRSDALPILLKAAASRSEIVADSVKRYESDG